MEAAITKKHLGFISALVALALTLLTAAGVWFTFKAKAEDAYSMGKENAVEIHLNAAETRQLEKRTQTLEDTIPAALKHIDGHLEKIDARLERIEGRGR